MAGPSIAVLLGKKPEGEEEEAPPSSEDMGGDEFSDLSPEEVVEHKHSAAEAFLKAIESGSPQGLLKAFEALHGLDHASWEHEGEGKEPTEGEEE